MDRQLGLASLGHLLLHSNDGVDRLDNGHDAGNGGTTFYEGNTLVVGLFVVLVQELSYLLGDRKRELVAASRRVGESPLDSNHAAFQLFLQGLEERCGIPLFNGADHVHTLRNDAFDLIFVDVGGVDVVAITDVYAAGEQPIEGASRDSLVEGMIAQTVAAGATVWSMA